MLAVLEKMLTPDIKAWMEIAAKSAWSKSDTRTSELVLISAARFSTEQRVKAWSICDYFFHYQPELVWQLDQCKTEEIRTPPDVEREFERRTGIPLPKIDHEWRTFWSRQAKLREAMFADPLGDAKGRGREQRAAARELVDAVNDLRFSGEHGAVGFYFAEDVDVLAALHHADKLVKVERDQKRKPKQKIPVPAPPAAIGRTVLFSRAATAAEAVRTWWANPALRDAMLHPGRGLLGANSNRNCRVLDLTEPVQATTRGLPQAWPRDGQQGVVGSARVGDLGARAIAALAAAGRSPDDVVAAPLTLHFARAVAAEDLDAITARVYYGGARVEGVLVSYQGGEVGDSADGCLAFLAFEPPPAGADVEVDWQLPADLRGEAEFAPVQFTVE